MKQENVQKQKRKTLKQKVIYVASFSISCLCILACAKLPQNGLMNPVALSLYSGYIIVASSLNQSVVLLDKDGHFVRELLVLDGSTTDAPTGVTLYDADNLLVAVDGVDRIMKVSLQERPTPPENIIINANLTGTLMNLTRLTGGDILVNETSNIERFNSAGTRIGTGGWPMALQTGLSGIQALSNGGFIACSTTADVVRAYSSTGTQTATAVSGIAATTDVRDCTVAADGRIAVAFSGTTDTIRIYTNANLSTTVCSYSDITLLGDPRTLAFTPEGHVLIADGTNNTIVEIAEDCTFVRVLSSSSLATPADMLVIP